MHGEWEYPEKARRSAALSGAGFPRVRSRERPHRESSPVHLVGSNSCSRKLIGSNNWRGRGGAVVTLLAFPQYLTGSIPGGGFPHMGIVPDDVAGRRVFSEISSSPLPPPLHFGAAPFSPRFTRIGSEDPDVISGMDPHILCEIVVCANTRISRHDGNTSRHARRCDETLGVRVSVVRIAPSLLDLGRRGFPRGSIPLLRTAQISSTLSGNWEYAYNNLRLERCYSPQNLDLILQSNQPHFLSPVSEQVSRKSKRICVCNTYIPEIQIQLCPNSPEVHTCAYLSPEVTSEVLSELQVKYASIQRARGYESARVLLFRLVSAPSVLLFVVSLKDEVDRSHWLRETRLRDPTSDCFSANTARINVAEVSLEQRRDARAGETGDPRENPLTDGIVRQDPHKRKFESDLVGNRPRIYTFDIIDPVFAELRQPRPVKSFRLAVVGDLLLHDGRVVAFLAVEEYTMCKQEDLTQGFRTAQFIASNLYYDLLRSKKYNPFTVTSDFPEPMLMFYFHDIPPPRANKA
ncbi:hypothetical protein PR048_023708 [Dryococelus australis]|uniref:Uncharacterized protein n=1 Tax=Dryococelus australis TaxID=614101 RepID=A0ABQ9GUV4_9NEOP|nr:hypothetical protein PR048_023708 [Dryococelus australis]